MTSQILPQNPTARNGQPDDMDKIRAIFGELLAHPEKLPTEGQSVSREVVTEFIELERKLNAVLEACKALGEAQ
jgi:hypothetical protein